MQPWIGNLEKITSGMNAFEKMSTEKYQNLFLPQFEPSLVTGNVPHYAPVNNRLSQMQMNFLLIAFRRLYTKY